MTDKPTILLVDDVPENLQVLYQALKDDYDVRSARSGAEALRVAEALRPALILLDVMMPEMDGFEVCRRLKQDEQLREVPVIFITAMSEEFNEVKGFEVGGVDYVTKPFKPLVLKKRVETQLRLKEQEAVLLAQNRELAETLARMKVLSGLVPICMSCKKIKDDQGFWNHLESYLTTHSEVLFSHGFCPECYQRARAEMKQE